MPDPTMRLKRLPGLCPGLSDLQLARMGQRACCGIPEVSSLWVLRPKRTQDDTERRVENWIGQASQETIERGILSERQLFRTFR